MKVIKAAIIGFMHMHVNEIALYISKCPGMELVGAADILPAVQEKCTKIYSRNWNTVHVHDTFGVRIWEDWTDMLEKTRPDIAFLLCEGQNKPEVVRICAKMGIDVCIEKPLASNLSDALEIREIIKASGIRAVVNWPTTWRGYIRKLASAYKSGVAGKLIKLNYINGHTGPFGPGTSHRGVGEVAEYTDSERLESYWYRKESGGAVMDIGCYGCMYSNWFQDESPVSVIAHAANLNTQYADIYDNITAVFEFPSAVSSIEGSWTIPQPSLPSGPALYCTDGVIYCTADRQVRAMDIKAREIPLPDIIPVTHPNMTEQYLDWLKDGKLHPTLTIEENIKVMAMLEGIVASISSGHREPVPDCHL